MSALTLYDYQRSSAAYRVRIALNLKGLKAETVPLNILPGHDEQFLPANRAKNPHMRVPFIETDQGVLDQSLAILEWLDETHPSPPLLPADPWTRAQARAFALTIACDIHPLNNLSVLNRLKTQFSIGDDHIATWYTHWIGMGFAALEAELKARPQTPFAFGDAPTIADICLVPQMANARRYPMELSHFPRLMAIDAHARAHPAFAAAAPQ
ncbi:MAG: maleylacetoacetate isomerase [Hyphomonadaceae bacterium]